MRIVSLLLLAFLATGCAEDLMTLPKYPEKMMLSKNESSDIDEGAYTAHVRVYVCNEQYHIVHKWYTEKLQPLGFQKVNMDHWTDGWAQPDKSFYYVTAVNPKKAGGYVIVKQDGEGTHVRLLQVKPKAPPTPGGPDVTKKKE